MPAASLRSRAADVLKQAVTERACFGCAFFGGFFCIFFFPFFSFCAAKSVPASWVEGTEFSKAVAVSAGDLVVAEGAEVLSFLALLAQKYKY